LNIKIKKNDFDFLIKNLKKLKPHLIPTLNNSDINNGNVTLKLDDEISNEINDWAQEEIQKSGYDENYDLNNLGKILQNISDCFSQ